MNKPRFRHELKYPMLPRDGVMLKHRLYQLLTPDPHAPDGSYTIRSLYFDDYKDKALFQKLDGTDDREKFRIRIYNRRDDYICVEKKVKKGEMTQKLQAQISREQCDRILRGDIDWLWRQGTDRSGAGVLAELYVQMREGLRPKTLVEYDRIPFVYGPGNVRVTLDCAIRSGVTSTDLFGDVPLVPVNPMDVLEVKYDAYLPDVIRMLVSPLEGRKSSVSKYVLCRKYL